MKRQRKLSVQAWRWAFYDWANSAFATTVMAGFFPIFFKSYWASELSDAESTFVIGSANSLVGLLTIALVSGCPYPLLYSFFAPEL